MLERNTISKAFTDRKNSMGTAAIDWSLWFTLLHHEVSLRIENRDLTLTLNGMFYPDI